MIDVWFDTHGLACSCMCPVIHMVSHVVVYMSYVVRISCVVVCVSHVVVCMSCVLCMSCVFLLLVYALSASIHSPAKQIKVVKRR